MQFDLQKQQLVGSQGSLLVDPQDEVTPKTCHAHRRPM